MATAKKNNYITAEQIARVIKPKNIIGRKHYLYVHKRLDNDEIFYIGIATLDRGKYYYRATCTKKRNQFWKNVAAKTKYIVFIISESDDKRVICDQEKNYIKIFGKRCSKEGTLCNLTDGGEGMFGHKIEWTQEMRNKIGEANRKRIIKDSTRQKHRDNLKARGIINKKTT